MTEDILTQRPDLSVETRVSGYDSMSSFLFSSILLVGFLVTLLFMIWLTMIVDFGKKQPAQMVYQEPYGNEKPEGFEDDIFEPGVEEFPEVDVPQLKDALEAVTDAVSSVRANLEARDGDAAEMGAGRGFGSRDGGPGSGNSDVIPEHKRWKIDYDSNNIAEYADQLSFFEIDIGVISQNTNDITRIRDVGGNARVMESNRTTEKKSLYFTHQKLRLRRWDETLSKRNSVVLDGGFTVQFYPNKTRQMLINIEQNYLTSVGRNLREVRRTFFKVVPSNSGFEFKLVDMNFRL